ncbi:DUF2442 domain-containing protein [Methylicorpusculum oleiharenae]|uniref:DUF2442 domain-containing protein n=1 Tax=Methylicorpusculum oleiharenae TaxID=1338687 RepID=UPI00135BAB55|nr:DUF2442 domain-containing protein [Methylicorpusculum oleiharenae]MCD2452754.1 DUF2442 domain-containing protein [Methylicorpusculum oleiharenae]
MKGTSINIISAMQIGEFRIRLIFDDNTSQEIDFKLFLSRSHHPDIRAYLEPARFAGFRVEYGELIWGDYELCFPIIDLYRNSIEHNQTTNVSA